MNVEYTLPTTEISVIALPTYLDEVQAERQSRKPIYAFYYGKPVKITVSTRCTSRGTLKRSLCYQVGIGITASRRNVGFETVVSDLNILKLEPIRILDSDSPAPVIRTNARVARSIRHSHGGLRLNVHRVLSRKFNRAHFDALPFRSFSTGRQRRPRRVEAFAAIV